MLDHKPGGFLKSGQCCTPLGTRDRRFATPPTHVHCAHYDSGRKPCCGCGRVNPKEVSVFSDGDLGSWKISELFKILRRRKKDLEEAFELCYLDQWLWINRSEDESDYEYVYFALTEDTIELYGVHRVKSERGNTETQRFRCALSLADFLYRYSDWLREQYARLEELRHEQAEHDRLTPEHRKGERS